MYLCGPRKHSCQPFCGPEGRFYCSDSVCSLWPAPFSYLCVRVRIWGVLKIVCGWESKTWLLPYACCGLHFIHSAAWVTVLLLRSTTPLHKQQHKQTSKQTTITTTNPNNLHCEANPMATAVHTFRRSITLTEEEEEKDCLRAQGEKPSFFHFFFLLGLLTRMFSEPPAWLYPAVFRHSEVPFSEPPHRSAHWGLLWVSEALLSSSWTNFWDGLSQVHRVSFKADLTERSWCWFVRLHLSRPLESTPSDVRELLRKLPRSWYVWHLLIQNKELPLCL